MTADPDTVLADLGPGAAELAVLLSCAVQIEPTLIRAVRLELAPRYDVSAEADLWFSDWVGTRSAESIRIRGDMLPALRERLCARLATEGPEMGLRLWDILSEIHGGQSPALLLEERLNWTAVRAMAGQARAADIDETLQPALRAVAFEQRTGVSDWFAAAWSRLPSAVQQTVTAWQLLQCSADREAVPSLPADAHLDLPDVYAIRDLLPDVRVPVRHDGVRLLVNERGSAGGRLLPVPDARPRILQVRWQAADGPQRATLLVDPDHPAVLRVGPGSVRVQTGRGLVYEVTPQPARQFSVPDPAVAESPDSGVKSLGTADALRQAAQAFRGTNASVDDRLVAAIESEVEGYREFVTRPGPAVPPLELAERLPLMGWLIYEASWETLQRIASGYEFLSDERRHANEAAVDWIARLAEAARALPWPEYAPRALGAILALALAASKRDTESGDHEARVLLREARSRRDDYGESLAAVEATSAQRLALDELLPQLALAEAGTACRAAERVIARWTDGLASGAWTADDEDRWVQRMFGELLGARIESEHALEVTARIESEHGLVHVVDEHRMATFLSYRNPAIMAARAALLLLALSPAMESLNRMPPGEHASWNATRLTLLANIASTYRYAERPIVGLDGTPLRPGSDHSRALVQLRLTLALLAPGYSLPPTAVFDPCVAVDPLGDEAVEALSAWLAEPVDGRRRGDANVIGSATMPAFIESVEACRAAFRATGGYREWRWRWFVLDRFADEPGRRERVAVVIDDHRDIDGGGTPDSRPDTLLRQRAGRRLRRPTYGAVTMAVRRVLARDDLLRVAEDADAAMDIVRQRDPLVRNVRDEPALFQAALNRHLQIAEGGTEWAIRAQALSYAGAIVQFCVLVGIPLDTELDAAALYTRARRDAQDSPESDSPTSSRYASVAVATTYREARSLRLQGASADAIDLLKLPDPLVSGTGAENYRPHFDFEIGASLLVSGHSAQVSQALAESKEYWQSARTRAWTSHCRRAFILGLAAWEQGDVREAGQELSGAVEQLHTADPDGRRPLDELSVTLALAECVAASAGAASAQRAVRLARRSLSVVESIPDRWRVIAGARTATSIALRRIYGDIARLAAALPGQQSADLGLDTCVSAKQTAFATMLRADRSQLTRRIRRVVDQVIESEIASSGLGGGVDRPKISRDLEGLRHELVRLTSPMLADAVMPSPWNLRRTRELTRGRYAMDFIRLPNTLTAETTWFRTLIGPGDTVEFDRLAPGGQLRAFLDNDDWASGFSWMGGNARRRQLPDWQGLAVEVLPASLLRQLRAGTRDQPVDLVISPDGRLSLLPWPALIIDEQGTRLVERAVVAQTPSLASLTATSTPAVTGPALVRLVSPAEGGVDTEPERLAWKLPATADGGVRLSSCPVGSDEPPTEIVGTLVEALTETPEQWRFVHIAALGSGVGLAQTLHLPDLLTAGQALAVRWPQSVLITADGVGVLPDSIDNAQIGFATALLAGGSQCVVAAIDSVTDPEAGRLAASIVRQVRAGPTPLDAALRRAQLDQLSRKDLTWAMFAAFKR